MDDIKKETDDTSELGMPELSAQIEDIDLGDITVDDILREAHGGATAQRPAEEMPAKEMPAEEMPVEDMPAEEPDAGRAESEAIGEEAAEGGEDETEADGRSGDRPMRFEPGRINYASWDGSEEDVPDPTEETTEERGGFDRPAGRFTFTRELLILLAGMAVAVLLLGIAVLPDLDDPAWSVLCITSFVTACLPMVIGTAVELRDRGRMPTSAIMLAASVIYGLTGNLVEAVAAAVIYNICRAVFQEFTVNELELVEARISAHGGSIPESLDERRRVCLREIADGRIKPVVEIRRLEFWVLLGCAGCAVFFGLIPPLFDGMAFGKWIARGAVLLALCAFCGEAGILMTYLNGIEASLANGLFLSGTGAMSACAQVTSVLFNKTGTLTDGEYQVVNIDPVRISQEQLVYLAVFADAYSDHALARALRKYAGFEADKSQIIRHRIQPGYGSMVMLDGEQIVAVGNIDFMEKLGVRNDLYIGGETCVFVAVGRTCVGRIDFADRLAEGAKDVVPALKRAGVANVALMTGDNSLGATGVGKSIGITEIYSDCRPQDKAARLKYILDSQERDDRLMFVSRAGSNSELLEMANISVTLGLGSDATGAFPDVVVNSGRVSGVAKIVGIARSVRRKVASGFFVAAGIRLLAAILALTGVLPMWGAVLAIFAAQTGTFLYSGVRSE